MTASVLSEVKKNVRHIVIDRAGAKNALNREVVSSLAGAFNEAGRDAGTRVVLFYGAGDEAFCAGGDLKEMAALETMNERVAFFEGVAGVLESMYRCRKPIVAKVHGFALAGGMGLVAASDIVLASDDAVFGLPEINVGLVPMIVQRALERVAGQKFLSYLALTGERVEAAEAARHGLISKIFPKASLDKEALALAEKLAQSSTETLKVICESVRHVETSGIASELRDSALKVASYSLSAEGKAGIKNFLSKNKSKS